jgi:hypothetical protein
MLPPTFGELLRPISHVYWSYARTEVFGHAHPPLVLPTPFIRDVHDADLLISVSPQLPTYLQMTDILARSSVERYVPYDQ